MFKSNNDIFDILDEEMPEPTFNPFKLQISQTFSTQVSSSESSADSQMSDLTLFS